MSVAESIVQEGITSKDPALVATILAQREAGMPPSTIGRTFKVHHTTVGRILSAVEGSAS
jgi:DNA invertase Pin-like site-specific DNA recombinase